MPDFNEIYRNAAIGGRYHRLHAQFAMPKHELTGIWIDEAASISPEAVAAFNHAKPLTFSIPNSTVPYTLEAAARHARKFPFIPNRMLNGSDFADYGDRILLAELGYFSIDLPKKREAMDREAQRVAYLEEAYDVLHLDRTAVHNMIAAKMEATKTDGIWAKSTGEYAAACRTMDIVVLRRSPAIEKSISELGTPV